GPGATPLVAVADAPDWGAVLGGASPGEWSPPLPITAPDRRGEVTTWRFRVRPLDCSFDVPPRLWLLNTSVHEHANHSAPAGLWERHAAAIGPIEEQTEPSLLFDDGIDVPTLLDLFRLNAEWLTNAGDVLLCTEDFELFMLHAHFIDWAHHAFEGGVDPRHPDYDPGRRSFYEDAITTAYRLGDDLVGAVRAAAGPDADVLVVGDHGQDLHHTTVRCNEILAQAGLLAWRGDGEEVDWSATSAYASGNHVFVNTFGRDPEGIVMPREVGEVRAAVVEVLLSTTDPARGTRPVLLAGGKEEFEALGANGAGTGDVVFCLRSGYQARNDRGAPFTGTRLMREFTGGHDHFWPYDRRILTRLLAAGPTFRPGYRHRRTERVIDVAATAALALGITPPRHNEGHPITALCHEPTPAAHPDRLAESGVTVA
ncbi:MAG: hypothetical protein HOV94_43165, partial [Saccharothrix sp.]|nr:hypothetical protein [Saccharothrix sp.]